jgi:hypothetical protein
MACRLVARRLADDDGLDEVTHDRHQPLFDRFVGVVACEEDEFADPDLDVCRVELRLQLLDLPLKIHCRLVDCREFAGELFALDLEFVKLVVEDGKARPAFGMPVLDLLRQARLCRLDLCEFSLHLRLAGRGALQFAHLVGDHLLRNPVEDVDRVKRDGQAVKDALFQFMAGDRFAVGAAFPVKFVDRQALLAVGAAIAILSADRVGPAAFGALQHPAEEIFRAMCRVETVRRMPVKLFPAFGLTLLCLFPQLIRNNAQIRLVPELPFVPVVRTRGSPFCRRVVAELLFVPDDFPDRGGSVCLNSFGRFAKWISASIMPPPLLVRAR